MAYAFDESGSDEKTGSASTLGKRVCGNSPLAIVRPRRVCFTVWTLLIGDSLLRGPGKDLERGLHHEQFPALIEAGDPFENQSPSRSRTHLRCRTANRPLGAQEALAICDRGLDDPTSGIDSKSPDHPYNAAGAVCLDPIQGKTVVPGRSPEPDLLQPRLLFIGSGSSPTNPCKKWANDTVLLPVALASFR